MFLKTSMLLLSIVAYMAASPMSYNMVLNVTVAVLDHYHSSCVYFLQSNPKQSTNKYSYVHKIKSLAAMRKITIAVISGESLATTLDEQRCFPLYVIFSANGVLWNYFKQESIINRMSNAKWVLFLDKKTPLEYIFAEIYIPPNCEFLVAENGSVVSLIEVYNVNRTLPLQIQHTGNWSLSNGASWTTIPFHERRGDLQGIILQSGVNSYEVIESIYACEDRTAIKFCGEIQEIWHILEEVMNFTTNYTVPDDQSYGSRNKEGKWNGIMNLTADNKVEVGVGRFIFTDERMSVVSLLPPILISTMSVFIQESDLDDITWEYVLAPLSSDLWLTIIATMIILTLFLSITWFLGDRYGSHPEVEKYNICNSWISVFASFCQQGHDTTPYSWSCRLVFFTSYLTGVIVLVAYSATFISFLTVKKAVLPFTDFKGLLQDGTYKLGVLPNSAQMNYLQNSPDPILRNIFEKLVKPDLDNLPRSDLEGLRRACKSTKYAYFMSPFFVRQQAGDYHCTVQDIPDAFIPISASLIMSKKSHYRRIFTHRLQQMRRCGLLNAIKEKYLPFELREVSKAYNDVTLRKILPIFIIFMIGVLISIVSLIIEIQIHRRKM